MVPSARSQRRVQQPEGALYDGIFGDVVFLGNLSEASEARLGIGFRWFHVPAEPLLARERGVE